MKTIRIVAITFFWLLTLSEGGGITAFGEDAFVATDRIQPVSFSLFEDSEVDSSMNFGEKDPVKTRRDRVQKVQRSAGLEEEAKEQKRSQLQTSFASDGKTSLAIQENLTGDIVNLTKWTIITIVIGTLVAVGLKKFQETKVSPVSHRKIRVQETLLINRQQMLKLVEVDGERFLIASDQSGIKAVTLLPAWPQMDQERDTAFPSIGDEPASLAAIAGSIVQRQAV
ncbi:hypothetical protein SH668x_000903 [Planctomicrobium sp. SH668]|uniref:hypothetical protein n=1 Tax=Planctomicrobium sp. SH668 TaxID=3448126 RepID=UPI003F5B86CA